MAAYERSILGRKVIVTGAGRGIGRTIAEGSATEGADVMLIGRDVEALNEETARIEASGGKAFAWRADVADIADVRPRSKPPSIAGGR